MRIRALPSIAAAAFLLFAGAGQAEAQVPEQQATPDPPDREELVTFTEAYIAVTEVRMELNEKLGQAADPEEANALQQEAQQEMVAVLDEHDMAPERYGEITTVLNADAELRAEFEEIYEELTEGGGLGLDA